MQADVADDDVALPARTSRPVDGTDDQLAARQAFAEVVVRITLECQRDPARHERARNSVPPTRSGECGSCRRAARRAPQRRVSSDPSIVPTVRFTLRIGRANETGVRCSSASRHERDQLVVERGRRARGPAPSCNGAPRPSARPGRAAAPSSRGRAPSSDRSAGRTFSRSTRPIISSIVRKPSCAIVTRELPGRCSGRSSRRTPAFR